jgi:pyruvate/2-oxoglutarate dehydrogenase complex dihydrolipoamide dehydrogenase (E3) component
MRYDYDLICIGLGPAGMAVSIMGSEMGLKVCSIDKHKIGGECMNVGCIPSKALLRVAKVRHAATIQESMALAAGVPAAVGAIFPRINESIRYINEAKTRGMFDKVDLHLQEGAAAFVDPHTVQLGEQRITAKRIYIATGTKPAVPPIPGIQDVDFLTNENVFSIDRVPESMVIIGGGAIGCELAQAFQRLGCRCSIIQKDAYLVPTGEPAAGALLEQVFEKEGIAVYNGRAIERVEKTDGGVVVYSDQGERLEGERLLVAAGRTLNPAALQLDKAGVKVDAHGAIIVNPYLQTSQRHIYAVGDCNGHHLLTHAAMHQGMIALMNSMMPFFMRMDFRKFVVPWTVFTEPAISFVGQQAEDLDRQGIRYRTIEVNYGDYGAAIAEHIGIGSVKVYASAAGRVYGACIVGEGSGEMINEWALIMQKKIRLHEIMLLQHSFPTMGFLTKRAAETWMMGHMKSGFVQGMCRAMFRR